MTEQTRADRAGTQVRDVTADSPDQRPIRPEAVLRIEDLVVRFPGGGLPAVDGVSFSVERGEVLALVGESGSGKTVTAHAILGLLPSAATAGGSIQVTDDPAGRPAHLSPNVLGRDAAGWRGVRGRQVAMVFQEPQTALNPVRTIGWQLGEAIRAHQHLDRRAVRDRALDLLRLVGIPEPEVRIRSYPHQLSGGQKQRIVIALALANDPALLIADEPTTALDVTIQAEILQLLRSLRDRLGTAVLLITHNMGVVADLADRVLVMRHGRMVERGEVLSLFATPFTDYTRELLASVPRLPTPDGDPGSSPDRERPRPAVQVDQLTVDYPGRFGRPSFRALSDLSVELGAGQVLGVVGESGSGKTTLAKALTGQLAPSAGRVLIDGVDLATLRSGQLRRQRRHLGVVHQDPATTLDPLLSVGDAVAEPLLVHRIARGAALRERVRELLAEVALPAEYARRLPHELSGGQRQRVAIARALALRPSLLIADEPTSALDVTVQAGILRLLEQLQAELGFACVFISHDLAVIHEVSDHVLVLRDGRVQEFGAASELLRHPTSDYTRRLLAAVPVPDPIEQRSRH